MEKKVWFITGSSRGLGNSIARSALEDGNLVVATARNPEALEALVQKYGENVLPIALDVTKIEQVQAAISKTMEKFGRIDVVVNNAGYGNIGSIEETTYEDFRAQVETDLWGTINVTKEIIPIFRKQRSGHVIQISSIGGRKGGPGLGAYQVSKFGVEGLSEVLNTEASSFGVKVTIIEPGAIRTDWAGSSMVKHEVLADYKNTVGALSDYLETHTGAEIGSPDKMADVIVEVTKATAPPLRLPLGTDAYAIALENDLGRIEELKKWKNFSESVSFD